MGFSFFILDDDLSIGAILSDIIKRKELGPILGTSLDGIEGERLILRLRPDIVLIDFLITGRDGIGVIQSLRKQGFQGVFVMISQVSDKEMIAKAYNAGVEYFIVKPINVVEVVSVINRVIDYLSMRQTLSIIDRSLSKMKDKGDEKVSQPLAKDIKIKRILGDLGILGEPGAIDIIHSCSVISGRLENYILKEVYQEIASKVYHASQSDSSTIKAVEQRIRRAIGMALENVAYMGIEDYSDERFSTYSSCLFDFKEVKSEMDYIRKKIGYPGKVNIKKFLEGIVLLINMN